MGFPLLVKQHLYIESGPDHSFSIKTTKLFTRYESHWVNCPSLLRDATGKFPDYPADDEGGSAAIFMEKDPAEIEAELRAKVGLQSLHLYFILYFLL